MKKFKNIKAVIFDWAGTIIDYGCMAPTQVFIEVFLAKGLQLTIQEAREPMGLAKKDHLRALIRLDSIQKQWIEKFGQIPCDADVDAIYADLGPRLAMIVKNFTTPIPGAVELINLLKSDGVKVGSTTGYVAEMMKNILPLTYASGLIPDVIVNSSEVSEGRPFPWMIYRNCELLNVYPLNQMVKIGDTVADIEEGINAGMWTIGLTKSGNELGLSLSDAQKADPIWLQEKIANARHRLVDAGADFVAEGVWECLPILEEIDLQIESGHFQ